MNVYLDNSATTKPSKEAIDTMMKALTDDWYNPSALYRPAMDVENRVNAVRKVCLQAVHATSHKIVFTSGGTEADNIAILGHMKTVRQSSKVLIFSVQHPAVLQCSEELVKMGHEVQRIPVNEKGIIDLEALEKLIDEKVALICVMQVNNETGAIQPLEQIVELRNRLCPQASIHVDGVQGFLRTPINLDRLPIQSYAFSGHKIHACKGIGGLIFRKDYKIMPIVHGGGQEQGLRSGTQNTPGILMLGAAISSYPEDGAERMKHLKERLYTGLKQKIPQAEINGPDIGDPCSAPHILNMAFEPVRSQTMLFALEGDSIYVGNGSACSSKKQKLSAILSQMKLPSKRIDCSIRFSLEPSLSEEQIDYTIDKLVAHYKVLSKFVRR